MLRLNRHSNHHTITIIIQNYPIIKTINPAIVHITTKAHQANYQNKSYQSSASTPKHIKLAIKTNPITSANQKQINPPQIIHPSSNQSNQHFIIFQPFQAMIQMQVIIKLYQSS